MANSGGSFMSQLFVTSVFLLAASIVGFQEMNRNKTKGPSRGFLIFTIVWSVLMLSAYVFGIPLGLYLGLKSA